MMFKWKYAQFNSRRRRPTVSHRNGQNRWLPPAAVAVLAMLLSGAGASAQDAIPHMPGEVFMTSDHFRAAVVELRGEAMVESDAVRLRQLARWNEMDEISLAGTADLVLFRFSGEARQATLDLAQIKQTLEEAGVNLAAIHFSGAMMCKVQRSEARMQRAAELAVASAIRKAPVSRVGATPAGLGSIETAAPAALPANHPPRTLRELILADLCERLSLAPDSVEMRFDPADERLVNLAEPHFTFTVLPRRPIRNLGDITWDVTLSNEAGQQQVAIQANMRAWQRQLITQRAIGFRQVIGDADLTERRILSDRMPDGPALGKEQVVGQQAARDLGLGLVLTSRMVEAVQVVRVGELVTVSVENGAIRLRWVAEARENGAAGQVIRVRKPDTREEFNVILTGPQQARLAAAKAMPGE